MAWLYVPGLEGSNSDSSSPSPTIELYVTLSGKPSPRPPSWHAWKTRPWMKLLSGTISQPSQAQNGVEQWISSLQASRANHGPSQENSKKPTIIDGSGPISHGSFAKWDHSSSSWKTSQVSFVEELNTFLGTWPQWGLMQNGVCFQRESSGHHISGKESSSWPTPKASEPDRGPCPSEMKRRSPSLATQARWNTPTTRDYKDRGHSKHTRKKGNHLGRQAPMMMKDGEKSSTKTHLLNPRFVEWLMGLPTNWSNPLSRLTKTDFERWEMQWYPSLQPRH